MSVPFALDRPDIVYRAVSAALMTVTPHAGEAIFASGRASAETAWARHVGMYVMAVRLDANRTQAARYFKRDRSTVVHALRLVEERLLVDTAAARQVDGVERMARAILDAIADEERQGGLLPVEEAYRAA